MPDEPVGKLGEVNQPVLVDTDIHKRTEIRHVAHRPRQDHVRSEILHRQDVLPQYGRVKALADIASRFLQLRDDVGKRRLSHLQRLADRLHPFPYDLLPQSSQPAVRDIRLAVPEHGKQAARAVIGFGVHAGVVQCLAPAGNAEKSGALLECLCTDARHLRHLPARGKGSVFLPVLHDILRGGLIDAGNIGKQGVGGGIDVHADRIDAGLDHTAQRLIQPRLLHVMLVLPDADALGIDLDQLRQRILEPPRDGHGRALHHVEIREFLRRQLGRGIDRRARLADDDILAGLLNLLQQSGNECLTLP